MAETTSQKAEMTRDEMAEFLRSVADELDSDRGIVRVQIGNKEVRLSPPETIDTETTVTERSRRIRKDVEQLDLELKWNPARDTVRSEDDSETESESEPEPETESEANPGSESEFESGSESEPGSD